jgi:hypothetical protein
MPLGPYKTFGECVGAQKKKGKNDLSARKICGQIEKQTQQSVKQAGSNIKYEDENAHLYIKAFLLDASTNINQWGVSPSSLDQRINTFIGKPLVLTENFRHPMPPEMDRVGATEYDNDDDPYNTINVDEIVEHWLQYQEAYRVGSIIDITEKKGTYYAIIEITDPAAKEAFRNNDVPLFVSPAIAQLDPMEDPSSITNWTGIHLAIVSDPAYTIRKAVISGQCHGDSERCVIQLRQAAINDKKIPKLGCGFCRTGALARYAEIVKSWRTKHSVVINAKNPEDFVNSSIGFLNTNENLELTDNNQQTNDSTNKQQDFEKKQEQQGGDLGEQQQKGNPSPPKETTTKETETETKETTTKTATAEEIAIKVAGMAECVQIFQQNGVQDPQQAQQICKLAAQALMENQDPSKQPPAGGGQTQGAPRGTGQFGSVTEYEKELARYEAKVADLTEQLKTYKKGDKTDAQRIAELEEQVTTLSKSYKEKELEAYLVTKIADEELRNKKIKRFAELNLTIEDVKDIYPDNTLVAPKGNTGTLKKIAEVESSPISKVKLQVASTNNANTNEEDTKSNNNPVRERNNKIISSLLSKGGIY